VVGGAHGSVPGAQRAMTGIKPTVFSPIPDHVAMYKRLYRIYTQLHDAFGVRGSNTSLFNVMKELFDIRQCTRTGR
jgi:L-ribulokinase